MKKIILFIVAALALSSCTSPSHDDKKAEQILTSPQEVAPIKMDSAQTALTHREMQKAMPSDAALEVKAFKDSLGWGYDIYVNGKKSIHQPLIPAVMGNQGFANESDAVKTGSLMIYKIKHGIMPPAIDINELDSLKIRYKK